jgi:hypothetical protein
MTLLDSNESFLFSDKVKKYSPCGFWKQERILIITTESIYNIKKDKVKRCIKIDNLSGISKTMIGLKTEFTIHVKKEYDYRFISDRRNEIIDIIKRRYVEKVSENLPIFGIEKEKLAEFTTCEKAFKKGYSRFPPSQFRLASEDIIASTQPEKASVYESSDAQEDL